MYSNCLYLVLFLLTIFHVLLVGGQMRADPYAQCFIDSFNDELHLFLGVYHNADDIFLQFKDDNHTVIDCETVTEELDNVNITFMQSTVNTSTDPLTPVNNICGATCTTTNCTWLFRIGDASNTAARTIVDQDAKVTCHRSALDVALVDSVRKNESIIFQESVVINPNVDFRILDINMNELTGASTIALGQQIFIQLTTFNPNYFETNGYWGSKITNCFVSASAQPSELDPKVQLTGSDGCAINNTEANLNNEFVVELNRSKPEQVATLGPITTFMIGSNRKTFYFCDAPSDCTGDFDDHSNAQCHEPCQPARKRREAKDGDESGYHIRYVATGYLELAIPCRDFQDNEVPQNARFKVNNCMICTCIDGDKRDCVTPMCTIPTCADARPIEGECCGFECPDQAVDIHALRMTQAVIVGVSAAVGLVIIITVAVGVCLVVASRRRKRDETKSTEKKQINASLQEEQFANSYQQF